MKYGIFIVDVDLVMFEEFKKHGNFSSGKAGGVFMFDRLNEHNNAVLNGYIIGSGWFKEIPAAAFEAVSDPDSRASQTFTLPPSYPPEPELTDRQYEADDVIRSLKDGDIEKTFIGSLNKAGDYYDKYLKPKDGLFKLVESFVSFVHSNFHNECDINPEGETYGLFKKTFRSHLKGTRGMHLLLNYIKTKVVFKPSDLNELEYYFNKTLNQLEEE